MAEQYFFGTAETSNFQFIYLVLILPTLFGLTLVGEGLNKILKSEKAGWLSIAFGIVFCAVVIWVYLILSGKSGSPW